jgi:hypothetical protein
MIPQRPPCHVDIDNFKDNKESGAGKVGSWSAYTNKSIYDK